uniref:SNARE-associated protein Snapin n=1 Tax=Melanaphis sacchari TaxID=742174 RepID=A0A2H8TT48_9HEMI
MSQSESVLSMDNEVSATKSIGATVLDLPLNRTETVATDYSPDDEDLDEAAAAAAAASEATRDTLADGLVASLLRPCVDRLDASVQCTRLSQLDLKLQLDSLATELKRLSLAQHDYLFAAKSISSPQLPVSAEKTISPTATATTKTTTDTCVLLDGYARRLCDARAKIAVVGNILESTQVLLLLLVLLYTNTQLLFLVHPFNVFKPLLYV